MVEFVLTISGKDGKSYKKGVAEAESSVFLNKKVDDTVKGDSFGLKGYELKITGGSDTGGFPIRKDVTGLGRKRPLVVSGVGAKPKEKGVKQKKTVHSNLISEDIKQINLKVEKAGKDSLNKIFNPEPKEVPKEESKPEEKKEGS
jgi:small subunit ribosomal protein S6e